MRIRSCFTFSQSTGLRVHPYNVFQGKSLRRRRERRFLSLKIAIIIRNKLPFYLPCQNDIFSDIHIFRDIASLDHCLSIRYFGTSSISIDKPCYFFLKVRNRFGSENKINDCMTLVERTTAFGGSMRGFKKNTPSCSKSVRTSSTIHCRLVTTFGEIQS